MVTSLCFGGDDLKDLYIVTGSRGGPSESCGTVYRLAATSPACRCRWLASRLVNRWRMATIGLTDIRDEAQAP